MILNRLRGDWRADRNRDLRTAVLNWNLNDDRIARRRADGRQRYDSFGTVIDGGLGEEADKLDIPWAAVHVGAGDGDVARADRGQQLQSLLNLCGRRVGVDIGRRLRTPEPQRECAGRVGERVVLDLLNLINDGARGNNRRRSTRETCYLQTQN